MAAFKDSASTLGPVLVSACASAFFSGVLVIQGTTYFRSFPNDNRWLKWLVGSTILLCTLQTFIWIYLPWRWLIRGYGDPAALFTTSWTYGFEPIISQLMVSLAQAFFVYRSYILTQRSKVLVYFLGCGILAGLAFFSAYSVKVVTDFSGVTSNGFILIIGSCCTLTMDVVITGVTTWKLLIARTGANPSTDNGLSKLLQITWEAAIPPALAAVVNVILLFSIGSSLFIVLFGVLVPRLYVFSLIFTLNSRCEVRRVFDADLDITQ